MPLLAGEGLPNFEAITPEQVEQGIPALLDGLNAELTSLETTLEASRARGESLGWHAVMDPLHHLGERLRWSWGVVSHLNGVCNTPELRSAHQQQQSAVVAFGNRAGQSRSLYGALQALQQRTDLDGTQRRIVEAERREMTVTRLASELLENAVYGMVKKGGEYGQDHP